MRAACHVVWCTIIFWLILLRSQREFAVGMGWLILLFEYPLKRNNNEEINTV